MEKNQSIRHRLWTLLGITVWLAIACHPSFADDTLVGPYGDLRAIVFSGCKQFSPEGVRQALEHDPTIQIASSPSAPLPTFINLIAQRLTMAYQTSGYGDAVVTAALSPTGHHLIVQVREGNRYTAGPIEIEGPAQLDRKAIRAALENPTPRETAPTHPDSPPNSGIVLPTWSEPEGAVDPLWEAGKTAYLSKADTDDCVTQIENTLACQGYFWPKITVSTKLHPDKTASLIVQIQDQGPHAVVSDMQMNGLSINTPKEILDFAGLKKGMPVDLRMLRAIRKKFWDSGRFYQHDITAKFSNARPGAVTLIFDFFELSGQPPLSVPFPPDSPQAIVLRAAPALEQSLNGADSIQMQLDIAPTKHFQLTFQSRHGALFQFLYRPPLGTAASNAAGSTNPNDSKSGPETTSSKTIEMPVHPTSTPSPALPFDFTAILDPDQWQCFSQIAARRSAVAGLKNVTIETRFVPDPSHRDRPHMFKLFANISSTGGMAPLQVDSSIAPVCCLSFLAPHPHSTTQPFTARLFHGILHLDSDESHSQVDARTARLIEATAKITDSATLHISVQPDLLKSEIAQQKKIAEKLDGLDTEHPILSAIRFIGAMNAKSRIPSSAAPDRFADSADLWTRVATNALGPIEPKITNALAGNYDLNIPIDHDLLRNPLLFLTISLQWDDATFDYGTWPWVIWHEGILVAAQSSPHIDAELNRLAGTNVMGPIGFACLSAAVGLRSPTIAQIIAKRGLDHLTTEDFNRDYRILFQGHGLASLILARLLQSTVDLSDTDFQSLLQSLPDDWAQILRYVRQIHVEHPTQPITDALAQSTDGLWTGGLEKIVEAQLQRQADAPVPASSAPTTNP